jgi:hypothetical protein
MAPVGTVSAEPPDTAAAVSISSCQRRSRRARSSQLAGKRPRGEACTGPQQRQRARIGDGAENGGADAAGDATAATLAAVGTDQQAAAPVERDRGCHSGSQGSKNSVGIHAKGTATDAGPSNSIRAELRTPSRTVMAGTGEVLAADMADSTGLLQRQDWKGLRRRLQRDGYLLLRGVLQASTVLKVLQPLTVPVLLLSS